MIVHFCDNSRLAVNSTLVSPPVLSHLQAMSDIPTRKAAYNTLCLYLQRPNTLSSIELLKLWKGLFYCMWMTSNPKPQQRLAEDIASLVTNTLMAHNVLPFVEAFWQTMAREWLGIDGLRMDKYLRLIRLMFRASLRFISERAFVQSLLQEHNSIVERIPLNTEDVKIPNGLRYHVLDIFVDEVEDVKDVAGNGMGPDTVRSLLAPVERIKTMSKDKSVRKRATEALLDDRLNDLYCSEKNN